MINLHVGGAYCVLEPEVPPEIPRFLSYWHKRLKRDVDPDTGEVGLEQRMTNVSNGEVSFYLRDRTLCKGGGYALLPLGDSRAGTHVHRFNLITGLLLEKGN